MSHDLSQESPFIHNGLQPGDRSGIEKANRFNGFALFTAIS
jgi:hypothetical protein